MGYRVTYFTSGGNCASVMIPEANNAAEAISMVSEQCSDLRSHPNRIKRVTYEESK